MVIHFARRELKKIYAWYRCVTVTAGRMICCTRVPYFTLARFFCRAVHHLPAGIYFLFWRIIKFIYIANNLHILIELNLLRIVWPCQKIKKVKGKGGSRRAAFELSRVQYYAVVVEYVFERDDGANRRM